MAKRKVMVDVVVDDKGTTKKMADDQRQLKKAMDGTAESSRNERKQIKDKNKKRKEKKRKEKRKKEKQIKHRQNQRKK